MIKTVNFRDYQEQEFFDAFPELQTQTVNTNSSPVYGDWKSITMDMSQQLSNQISSAYDMGLCIGLKPGSNPPGKPNGK